MIVEHAPQAAAVEEVFFSQNVKTALKLAHVRGVALLAIAEAGVQLGEYSPLEVKISVVGYGRAEKQQVQLMVQSLTGVDVESEDAADAIAVAICHATHSLRASSGGHMIPLLIFGALAFADPRIVYTKSFPGSDPAYVEIAIDSTGAVSYKEAPDDDDPETFKLGRGSRIRFLSWRGSWVIFRIRSNPG